LEIIASFDQPVGFVSLVGKMRTGKSCLMNRLLHLSGEGVIKRLCSLKLILRLQVALREFGCGPNHSLINNSTTTFSF